MCLSVGSYAGWLHSWCVRWLSARSLVVLMIVCSVAVSQITGCIGDSVFGGSGCTGDSVFGGSGCIGDSVLGGCQPDHRF